MSLIKTRIRRGLGWVAVVLTGALLLCLEGVDYTPYFRTSYYSETRSRLSGTAQQLRAEGTIEAGFGRVVLTPAIGVTPEEPAKGRFTAVPLAGYGNRGGRPAAGVHDDVLVKAVAIRVGEATVVMVGIDALIIPREVSALVFPRVLKELNLMRHQVYLGATHTHSSLGGWGEGMVAEAFAGGFKPGVREWMADRIVEAVELALKDLSAATFAHGSISAPRSVRNRLVGDAGTTDPQFPYLAFRQADGDVGVVGSFAAHATVLSADNMQFSGDYPGVWQRAVETELGGMAVFIAGAVGSHSPVTGEGPGGMAAAERLGKALAGPVVEAVRGASFTNRMAMEVRGLEVTLPELHARVMDGVRLRPWLASRFLPVGEGTFLQGVRLGRAVWVSTPCDFSGELAVGIQDTFARRGFQVALTSFNGDYIGYIIPGRYYHLNGYESRVMSFFGPTMGDYLDDLTRRLGRVLTAGADGL